jgi:4-amino-4-deoxy-L-arabinose transferase-like glycosyltransferase
MPLQPAWAQPRNVTLLIAAYLLVHFAVRLWMGPTLGIDDAEQALFAQHWLLNYRFRAPPLFTWMLVALSDVLGPGMLAISLIRYTLLVLLAASAYLTARRLIRDQRLAALATFSFVMVYVFGFYSHHDLTHTTVLSTFLAASWYVFVRLCETPSLRWYLALGLCFGLGTLGKWNFVMFALALPLASLFRREYRGLVLAWKVVPAGLVAAALVLPSALWALHLGPSPGDSIGTLLGAHDKGFLLSLVIGTLDLVRAVLVYPQPFLVLFLLVFARAVWRGLQTNNPPTPAPVPDSGFVGLTIAIAIALHWALVPLAGATNFDERLLQPALFILPVYLFMLVERGDGASPQAISRYMAIIAAVAAIALAARIGIHAAGADYCRGACRALAPFEAVAAELKAAGFHGRGTIVAPDFHVGGNLRVQFPGARIIQIGYPARTWPQPKGNGQCLAVWPAGDAAQGARAKVDAYLAKELGAAAFAPRREGVIAAPMLGSATRIYRLAYALYDGPQGQCR